MSNKKYKLEDLQIGMQVTKEELEDIYDVTIYFDHYDYRNGGKIIYFGESGSKEAYEAVKANKGVVSTFYQNSLYADEAYDYIE